MTTLARMLGSQEEILDVKVYIGNYACSPSDIIEQGRTLFRKAQECEYNQFVDNGLEAARRRFTDEQVAYSIPQDHPWSV